MQTEPNIPEDTLLRMALISERHLKGEYEYMRVIVSSHERELAWLSLAVVCSLAVNYYLCYRVYRLERNDATA